jgi:hypothetical protein
MRGQKVMIDSDLTALYQVETFNLNKTDLQTQGRLPFLIHAIGRNWRCLNSLTWLPAYS